MPDIRLDLSEAQFADNLLFGIIDRLTASIERSKSRELYRESLDMRVASNFTNTLLQNIDKDDPIALQNAIDLLYKKTGDSPAQEKLTNIIAPNLKRQKGIALERKELFKNVQKFQSDLSKLTKDNLVGGKTFDNIISGLKTIDEGLLSETLVLDKEDKQLIQSMKAKGEKFLQVYSLIQRIDVSAKEGLQLGERLGDINISGEAQSGTRLLLEESFKAFESKDITRSLTLYDKALASATKIEAGRLKTYSYQGEIVTFDPRKPGEKISFQIGGGRHLNFYKSMFKAYTDVVNNPFGLDEEIEYAIAAKEHYRKILENLGVDIFSLEKEETAEETDDKLKKWESSISK